jgi:hypothetical protein
MKTTYIYGALIVVIIGGLVAVKMTSNRVVPQVALTPIDTFAQCLGDAGAKFYGAYWCPHCQAQKKLFNNSKKLPYVECSMPDGKAQTPVCITEKITGYPTWVFKDGTRVDGEQTFEELSTKTGCVVPVDSQK